MVMMGVLQPSVCDGSRIDRHVYEWRLRGPSAEFLRRKILTSAIKRGRKGVAVCMRDLRRTMRLASVVALVAFVILLGRTRLNGVGCVLSISLENFKLGLTRGCCHVFVVVAVVVVMLLLLFYPKHVSRSSICRLQRGVDDNGDRRPKVV